MNELFRTDNPLTLERDVEKFQLGRSLVVSQLTGCWNTFSAMLDT